MSQPPQQIKSISEFHRVKGLPRPEHPLISLINFDDMQAQPGQAPVSCVFGFYSIALKRDFSGKMKYGQQEYDFDEGLMTFMSPGQILRVELPENGRAGHSGWLLLVHPDLLWNTALATQIKHYGFFDYAVNEALFLSDKEEGIITGLLQNLQQEYQNSIDKFSRNIIIAQLELLLNYAERFYQRQFISRSASHHQILTRLEALLTSCFEDEQLSEKGLPAVIFIAGQLHVSPDYLSGLLKTLTGLNTQQHIHQKLIEKAKEKLSATDLSVSEIAYQLGFGHLPSFSKLFKAKTSVSPLDFRRSFN